MNRHLKILGILFFISFPGLLQARPPNGYQKVNEPEASAIKAKAISLFRSNVLNCNLADENNPETGSQDQTYFGKKLDATNEVYHNSFGTKYDMYALYLNTNKGFYWYIFWTVNKLQTTYRVDFSEDEYNGQPPPNDSVGIAIGRCNL